MELTQFRRQYLITNKNVAELENWKKETFNGMNVYTEQSLQMYKCQEKDKEFLLLGYWINPHAPGLNNEEILNDIFSKCQSIDNVYIYIYYREDLPYFAGSEKICMP